MSMHYPASLTRVEWVDALLELSLGCADDRSWATGDRTREMNALLQLAPEQELVEGLTPLSVERINALLAVDATETAVFAMLGDGGGYMLSQGSGCQALATVALPSRRAEKSCAGATPALALVGALALSLADAGAVKPGLVWRALGETCTGLH